MELQEEFDPIIPKILPHDKVYSIQVGYKLFKISGASLSSDAPSYFTTFFYPKENENKVLFIDRNPQIFDKIYMHLQGYHIDIETDFEYMYLWQDAHYFSLRRLQRLLNDSPLLVTVGSKLFKVPRSLLTNPANSPNYFSVAIESLYSEQISNRLKDITIRPLPQSPVLNANRSSLLFADLLEILYGNDLVIRDDNHRTLLIKECRYYRFSQLEQKLIKHQILKNPFYNQEEILIDLKNISTSHIKNLSTSLTDERYLCYCRPYLAKDPPRQLIIQIDSSLASDAKLIVPRSGEYGFLVLMNELATRLGRTFKPIADDFLCEDTKEPKLSIPCILSESFAIINNVKLEKGWRSTFFEDDNSEVNEEKTIKKRKKEYSAEPGDYVDLKLIRSLWRITTRSDKYLLHGVSIQAVCDKFSFNKSISFL